MQTKGNEMGSGMHKVLIVYGTRSEAIKVAPLIREIERSSHCTSVVAVTGNTEKCSIRSRANCQCALSRWHHFGEPCGSRWSPDSARFARGVHIIWPTSGGVESRCGAGNAQARLCQRYRR